jgi:hypothetical protein
MIAELKIYKDCSSEEPINTYTIRRMPSYVTAKMTDILTKIQEKGMSNEDAMTEFDSLFKMLFPEITDEELRLADFGDKMEVIYAIARHYNSIGANALKN